MWEDKLRELGYDLAQLRPPAVRHVPRTTRDLVDRIEAIESGNAAWYQSLRNIVDDPDIVRILDRIDADEAEHLSASALLEATRRTHGADRRLRRIWRDERWHKQGTAEWVGDAIYGVNDGLAAIFGIISGVAGYTDNTHTVLVSGLFGALASTLSMGAGAWLATKSENELMESEMAQERREIAEDPEHELEELALLYELKGFSPDEANRIARQIGEDPERLLQTMAREELGIHETSKGNPWKSAWYGTVSTLVGGLIPLVPFFFLSGLPAMVAAAVVSIVAHFAVGAAKSLVTVRKWWASGLEMTVVGAIVGVVSYGLGLLGSALLG
ncbi:MAG: VIT1/CCC1 transporter family protein [Alicyclobacillaceae bacterium]|nr:VIT1/CCC1 transporter family protein [Alicyclobacillaceae bacterium]